MYCAAPAAQLRFDPSVHSIVEKRKRSAKPKCCHPNCINMPKVQNQARTDTARDRMGHQCSLVGRLRHARKVFYIEDAEKL